MAVSTFVNLDCLKGSSGFGIPGTGFRILCRWNLDTAFQLLSGILLSLSCILDSNRENFLESRIQNPKFPGLRNLESLKWGERNILAGRGEAQILLALLKAYLVLLHKAPAQRSNSSYPTPCWSCIVAKRASNCL